MVLIGETFLDEEYNRVKGLFGDQKSSREHSNSGDDCIADTTFQQFIFIFLENVCRSSISRSPVIAMMQTAKSGHHDDFAPGLRATHRYTPGRRLLLQRKMRPVLVVITDVIIHQAFQMAFIHDDHMVKHFDFQELPGPD